MANQISKFSIKQISNWGSAVLAFSLMLCSVSSVQAADDYTWGNVEINGGGFVSAVIASPIEKDLFYARTDVGGAYRWVQSEERWASMMDWVNVDERGLLGVEAIAVDPKTPGKLYMMTGTVYWNQADDGIGRSAFLKSVDYGASWSKLYTWDNSTKWFNVHGNGMGRGNGEALAIDPVDTEIMFYGTKNKGLWKSTNNGDSWAKVSSFPVDTTWNGSGISFVVMDSTSVSEGKTQRIYVGVLRDKDNVFVSEDAGQTWAVLAGRPIPTYAQRLMPQRMVYSNDGSTLYITYGDGAGPHTMAWDEGWGPIQDWFNRGAVFKYELGSKTWTDVSPQNLIDPANDSDPSDPANYFGTYSGVSIDPNDPKTLVVTSCASYRGTQFWNFEGTWKDGWGDNIWVSRDGGVTWAASFRYYWIDGGQTPPKLLDENGTPWMKGGTIHWIGSAAIDPFDPKRVFITSGNGVFRTDDIFDYTYDENQQLVQSTLWKFSAKGIEEVVPMDVVSIPDGPVVSVILDYDGFVHDDIRVPSPIGRHKTEVGGNQVSLGSTTGLAVASKTGKLAKVAKTREVALQYNTVPIGPVQYSLDTGKTWSVETYTSNPPVDLYGGKLALSADGAVTLWMPSEGTTMYRHDNSAWTAVTGVAFSGRPIADPQNESKFYTFNKETGDVYASSDAGASFAKAGTAAVSNFRNMKAAPGQEGDLWVPVAQVSTEGVRSGSLMRSVDGGSSFSKISGVSYTEAVGFGKAADSADYPAIYIYGMVENVVGVFQSIDEGKTWVRINDDGHEFGGLANGEFVEGDMNQFGVVYMSTAGRGIAARAPSGWLATPNLPIQKESIRPGVNELKIDDGLIKAEGLSGSYLWVYNSKGSMIRQVALSSDTFDLNTLNLSHGAYFISVKKQGKVLTSGLWAK